METVMSKDGTTIAYERTGSGSPLVLVHGTSASHTRWTPILPVLAAAFTVYAVDRRGRGESEDADCYAFEREFEDIAAVIDSIGEPVDLLGHSYGAICALEAALLTANIRRLVLYEPPIPVSGRLAEGGETAERLEGILEAGDREGVVTAFMREYVGMPEDGFATFRETPAWPARVAAAHTLPREVRAQQLYRLDSHRFTEMITPTMLLLGGASPQSFKDAVEVVNTALPDSRIVDLPGQHHNAMDTAPELFVEEVLAFLHG